MKIDDDQRDEHEQRAPEDRAAELLAPVPQPPPRDHVVLGQLGLGAVDRRHRDEAVGEHVDQPAEDHDRAERGEHAPVPGPVERRREQPRTGSGSSSARRPWRAGRAASTRAPARASARSRCGFAAWGAGPRRPRHRDCKPPWSRLTRGSTSVRSRRDLTQVADWGQPRSGRTASWNGIRLIPPAGEAAAGAARRKAHMHKKHLSRAPLLAVCGLPRAPRARAGRAGGDASRRASCEDNPTCASTRLHDDHEVRPAERRHARPASRSTGSTALHQLDVDGRGRRGDRQGRPDAQPLRVSARHLPRRGPRTPDNGGSPAGLSHVEFCTDGQNEPRLPGDRRREGRGRLADPGRRRRPVHDQGHQHRQRRADRLRVHRPALRRRQRRRRPAATPTRRSASARSGRTRAPSTPPPTDTADRASTPPAPRAWTAAPRCEDQRRATVTLTPAATTPAGDPPGTPGTPGGSTPGAAARCRRRSRPAAPACAARAVASSRRSARASTGRSIASVTFFVDGKLVKRFTGARASYSIKVNPRSYGFGRHRVVARVTFVAGSGTQARRLPLTFRRCARGTVAPRFTG